jgi:beta-lactam-binding protein with PASTA domain
VIGRRFGHGFQRASSVTVMTVTVLAVAACGAPDTPAGPAAVATTTAAQTPSAEATTSKATTQAPKAAKIEVPRGVGLDYQSAQDLWRAAGLHVAPAKDATGAGRLPVIDSNWIVVSQDPKAGSMVETGSFITATVKKDSDG